MEILSVQLTDNHDIEVEAFTDTLAMPLVGQVGETDVASQLAADHVLHVGGGLSCGLGIAGADGLGDTRAHRVAALDERRLRAVVGSRRVPRCDGRRDGGAARRWRSFKDLSVSCLGRASRLSVSSRVG